MEKTTTPWTFLLVVHVPPHNDEVRKRARAKACYTVTV